jgi:hypothetical protein
MQMNLSIEDLCMIHSTFFVGSSRTGAWSRLNKILMAFPQMEGSQPIRHFAAIDAVFVPSGLLLLSPLSYRLRVLPVVAVCIQPEAMAESCIPLDLIFRYAPEELQ